MKQKKKISVFKITETKEIDYITWKEIKKVLGTKQWKLFNKFMRGQTCIEEGAFVCDVENFLRTRNRFFD